MAVSRPRRLRGKAKTRHFSSRRPCCLSGAEASKKLDETLGQLAAAQKQLTAEQQALKAEQEVNAKHMEEAVTNTKKFQQAIEEACKLLNAALV